MLSITGSGRAGISRSTGTILEKDMLALPYPEDLSKLLGRVARDEPDRMVLIRADERSLHRYFAGVASLCRHVGINELKVGYLLQGPEAQATQ